MKLTPVLLVESIEKSLPFWMERLSFEKTAEVPDGDRLGFIMLAKDGADLMLQTWDSADKDVPSLLRRGAADSVGLFLVVDDFEDLKRRLAGYPIVLPERTTFYGMREVGVREPGGHFVIFASPVAK